MRVTVPFNVIGLFASYSAANEWCAATGIAAASSAAVARIETPVFILVIVLNLARIVAQFTGKTHRIPPHETPISAWYGCPLHSRVRTARARAGRLRGPLGAALPRGLPRAAARSGARRLSGHPAERRGPAAVRQLRRGSHLRRAGVSVPAAR